MRFSIFNFYQAGKCIVIESLCIEWQAKVKGVKHIKTFTLLSLSCDLALKWKPSLILFNIVLLK
jgi:hypothetical protein